MKYLSLFSGIGGFEIGINNAFETLEKSVGNRDHAPERAGDRGGSEDLPPERADAATESVPVLRGRPDCVGFSEIDRHASSVYKRHFPNHRELGDITKLDAAALPDFDLLVGGFPCQAFSVAGKRLGFDDTRGTLFFEIARILAVKKPRNFVLENVRGLLSHDAGRTFRTILATLNDLGYCVEWQVLNSKDFGVPQNRERVYIVGHLGGLPGRKVFPICGADGASEAERVTATTIDANYFKGIDNHGARTGVAVLQDVRGFEKKQNGKGWKDDGPSYTVDTMATQGIATGINWPSRGPEPREDRLACSQKAGESGTKNRIFDDEYRIRRLTPTECCRLQAFPDKWCDLYNDGKPVSDSQKYKMLGNAVTTSVVAAVVGRLLAVDNPFDTETSRA